MDEKVQQEAREIDSWLQDAMGDLADGMLYGGKIDTEDTHLETKFNLMNKEGAPEYVIKDWLAEELYNDVATMRDMAGDRVHDATCQIQKMHPTTGKSFNEVFCMVGQALHDRGHSALKKACLMMMKGRR